MIDFSEDLPPLSAEGGLLHRRAHDGAARERRSDTLILRGCRVVSPSTGAFRPVRRGGIPRHPQRAYRFQGRRVFGSRIPWSISGGKPKSHQADELQLCAQAMCLEEMLCCSIPEGALFSWGATPPHGGALHPRSYGETGAGTPTNAPAPIEGHTPKAKHQSTRACSGAVPAPAGPAPRCSLGGVPPRWSGGERSDVSAPRHGGIAMRHSSEYAVCQQ